MLSPAAAPPPCGARQGCSLVSGAERDGLLQRTPLLRRMLRRPVRAHAPVAWSASAPARAAPGCAGARAVRAAAAAASGPLPGAVRAHGARLVRAHARGQAAPGGAGGAPGYDSGSESENESSAASGFGLTMSQLLERHRCAVAPARAARACCALWMRCAHARAARPGASRAWVHPLREKRALCQPTHSPETLRCVSARGAWL
jgi:hypothetical protein